MRALFFFAGVVNSPNSGPLSWACTGFLVACFAGIGLFTLKVRRDFAREAAAERAERRRRNKSSRVS